MPRRQANLNSPSWASSEDEVLRQLYVAEGAAACLAKLPGRTRESVKKRAAALGLRIHAALEAANLVDLERACRDQDHAAFELLAARAGLSPQRLRQEATQRGWSWPGKVAARPWTPADDAQLAELYKTATLDACAAQLQRDPVHVKRRIKHLQLSKAERAWTPEDDRQLAELYAAKKTGEECAAALKRTKGAVWTRARELQLTVKPAEPPLRKPARKLRPSTFRNLR